MIVVTKYLFFNIVYIFVAYGVCVYVLISIISKNDLLYTFL